MLFKLKVGKHVEPVRQGAKMVPTKFFPGDVVESPSNLVAMFGADKFERVSPKVAKASAGKPLQPTATGSIPAPVPNVEEESLESEEGVQNEPEEVEDDTDDEAGDDVTAEFKSKVVDPDLFTIRKDGKFYTVHDADDDEVMEGGEKLTSKRAVVDFCKAQLED